MTELKRLPTPDAPLTPSYRQVLLTVPSNADLERYLWGALSAISYWTSWDEVGTMTAEQAAAYVKAVLMSRQEFSMLGVIVPVYLETLPTTMLLCDGSVYNKVDYPQLWELLPLASKDATSFTLPDLRSKFLLGASVDYLAGSSGGEADVTLTVAEMPSHTHSYFLPTFNIDVESVGVPDPTGVGQPALSQSTGSQGGDQPHNNMPPYFAVRYAIIAKVSP